MANPALTKPVLEALYVSQQMPIKAIAKALGFRSHTSIKRALVEFGIPTRSSGWASPSRKAAWQRKRQEKGYEQIGGSYWCAVRNHARQKDREFSITIQYAWEIWENQNGCCALSGVQLKFAYRADCLKGRDEQTASLDRIDSSLGYVVGNVQWIHKDIQRMKMDMDEAAFIEWCSRISQQQQRL